MAIHYELELGRNDLETAISYLVRAGTGHFFARKEEVEVKGVPTTKVYYGNPGAHLFDVALMEGDRVRVSVPLLTWPFFNRRTIREVQDSLSGK